MTESLARLLLRLSEAGEPAFLWGRQAKPYLDRDLERLLARGVLTEQAPADEWDVCADCECGLPVRPVQCINGDLIAACPLDHARDVRLDAHDLRSFSINAAAIVDEIAAASGFAERPSQVMPGVWCLGRTPTKRSLFITLGRNSVLAPGLITTLRATEDKRPITLIAPAAAAAEMRRFAEAGVHFVATVDAFAIAGPAFALDPHKLTPPASIEPRLTLFRFQSKMVFEGRELELPPISFRLLWLLAERVVSGEGIVTRLQIEKHLWSTVVSKTVAADATRNLRDALRKLDNVKLVRTLTTQGYKFLAKLASDHRKPDGLFVITPAMGPGFVEELTVDRFHGVGPATAAKMNRLGFFTALDLRAKDEAFLRTHFGKAGPHYFNICRGIDHRPVCANRVRKSVGAENTFPRDLSSYDEMKAELDPLVGKVWRYCESSGVRGRTVTLKVKFADFQVITRSHTGLSPVSDRSLLATISADLLAAQFPMPKSVRLIGVSLSSLCADLGEGDPQMTLAL